MSCNHLDFLLAKAFRSRNPSRESRLTPRISYDISQRYPCPALVDLTYWICAASISYSEILLPQHICRPMRLHLRQWNNRGYTSSSPFAVQQDGKYESRRPKPSPSEKRLDYEKPSATESTIGSMSEQLVSLGAAGTKSVAMFREPQTP
ncbi:hypothetical protein CISG_01407 [Coccidioides immitis RMSCC 3703]|uniref:Uncharacterized protein n=2 Tax=Coccidioides immitis TaxID=5501 RepID=A0A0J8R025_COCIT|nr:hypothetical protein CIRG_04805 [Coccidioides immitis RMSCC 2394]KMU77650.1 hypothetical protein CISG_01407 [Coccidioides immitis RMSCC 3703]